MRSVPYYNYILVYILHLFMFTIVVHASLDEELPLESQDEWKMYNARTLGDLRPDIDPSRTIHTPE